LTAAVRFLALISRAGSADGFSQAVEKEKEIVKASCKDELQELISLTKR
jgi:hypothetical protein